jgi:cytochrome oxidase Cu insertion factor (SCO1/SenC/PrrC family)
MTSDGRSSAAVGALGAIVAITASWWALALWPVGTDAPEWFLRTREVCFGASADSLPHAGGWLLLVGQPAGMLLVLVAVWGAELREGLSRTLARLAGQLVVGATSAALVAGIAAVAMRVSTAGQEAFAINASDVAAQLTRVNDAAPPLALVDQSGQEVSLESFRGRPVLVTFAFAHCATVCPLIVSDVLTVRSQVDGPPPVLVITLDPWRDTPSRLPTIASSWNLGPDAHVLSGPIERVERTLNAWRIPRTRNQKTGDIVHPSMVYVIGPDGRIAYVVTGGAGAIAAAVRVL